MNSAPRQARAHQKIGDRGYAAILTALLIVPLLGFAGFAVDIGSWYSRASSLQRAADAAALAGVVWQPSFAEAEAAARAEAARNGFTHDPLGTGITVNVTDSGDNQLAVEIIDADADLYFAGLFLDNVTIGRRSIAEYVLPVPMGSPKNHFGTNDLVTASPENFSAAINGSCTPREQGDHRSTHFVNSWGPPGYYSDMLCPTAAGGPGPDVGWSGNTTYNVNPYYERQYSFGYIIDVPSSQTGSVDVYLRDPNFNTSGPQDGGLSGSSITTEFLLRGPDGTPLNSDDNLPYTACSGGRAGPDGFHSYPSGVSTGAISLFGNDGATWDLFCRIPAGATGRYFLDVGTVAFEPKSVGSNLYAVLARPTTGSVTCDTRVSPSCPAVVAREWMSIYAAGAGATAEFFLAEIGDEHEGKRLKLTLFDAGEGSNYLQVIGPDGVPVSFTWSTLDGSFSGSGTTLTVSQTCTCYRPSGNASTSKFSDRFVEISIDLPTDFSTSYSTSGRWWKIKYFAGTNPSDRTSWSVEIRGDPVRLTE